MKRAIAFACVSLFAVVAGAADTKMTGAPMGDMKKEEEAIMKTMTDHDAAWAKGDVKGRVAVMAEDATVINPMGTMAKGKAEIEKLFTQEMDMFKGTSHKISNPMYTWISPTMVWVDADGKVTGMKTPPATTTGVAMPEPMFHVVFLMEKKADKWMWKAARPYAFMPPPPAATASKK